MVALLNAPAVLAYAGFGFVTRSPIEILSGVLTTTAAVVYGALSWRIIAGDRQSGAWLLFFQRPGSPVQHYVRILLTVLAIGAAFVCLVAISLSLFLLGVPGTRASVGALVTAILWGTTWACIAFGISSFVERFDFELVLVTVVLSYGINIFMVLAEVPSGIRDGARLLLFPVDGITRWGWLVAGRGGGVSWDLLHAVIYPAVWVVIGVWGLRRGLIYDVRDLG